ncbi:MAG: hypothetical protein DWQ02_07610 [Bacteroidetes bacterium]|nr:MAG: hypothetical protein DWQ02_07610 [Bacteroidota bacterium]
MKKFKIHFGMVAMFFAIMLLSACNNTASDNTEGDSTETTEVSEGESSEANAGEATEASEGEADGKPGLEVTSMYICPMHCDGSGSSEPGKCPACEMDYVFNAPYHSAYICPMHCKGSGADAAGQCPECGMDYVKNEHVGHTHG